MLLFASLKFWVVFIVFVSLFALIKRCSRLGMILYVIGFSMYFFYTANGGLMVLLPLTALFTWLVTEKISSTVPGSFKKFLLSIVVVGDLLPLLYFKYTNFCLDTLNTLLHTNFPLAQIVLPVGISFYTFQAISYTVDVYRGRYPAHTPFLEFLFYLSFFPLLLAGPITRAKTLLPQIKSKRSVSSRMMWIGFALFLSGLVKKSVIADYIVQFNNWIFESPADYSGFENLMGVLGYTVQIFCDFSGYSDMSIGLAALLGFRLKDNFNMPYRALNPGEFWHRWHISLSTWFRDYLYIPLGGNRKGNFRTYLNNIITMLVAGLWHGATWMFVLWGGIHGAALAVHKALKKPVLDKLPNKLPVLALCWLLNFCFVSVAWVFFRSPNLETCFGIFKRIAADFDMAYLIPFIQARPVWFVFILIPLFGHLIREKCWRRWHLRFARSPWIVKLLAFLVVVQLVVTFKVSEVQAFIYAQF